ncbi:MAG TPA: transglycosylase SLT domain-containing protein [Thermodesulfobacteriota bacterium]|nr:transglycosylase SLT domain-containing protein [Thermodesulfobacteriota bacterium]
MIFITKNQKIQPELILRFMSLFFVMLAVVVLLFFHPLSASADIYRYIDEKGTVHFTNVPTDKRYKLYLHSCEGYFRATKYDCKIYDPLIREMATKYQVDGDLVRAVIKAESDFNPSAVSPKGAKGIMQLMPETAEDMSVKNIFSPRDNIEGGVKYLRRLLNLFNNDLHLTVAAYNAGENAVIGCNYAIPPYCETQDYVKKVLLYLRDYKNGQGGK